MILEIPDFTDQDHNVIQNNSASQMSTQPLPATIMCTVEGGKCKGGYWITVYRQKSFPSKGSDTKDLTEYIFRLRRRHHQLLFK